MAKRVIGVGRSGDRLTITFDGDEPLEERQAEMTVAEARRWGRELLGIASDNEKKEKEKR